MEGKEERLNIPTEIKGWYKKGLIDEHQLATIKERFTSDASEAIEYFLKVGLIDRGQYKRLRHKYIPDEIERWYKDGVIESGQLARLRRGYDDDVEQVIKELERTGDLDREQAKRIGALYDIELFFDEGKEEGVIQEATSLDITVTGPSEESKISPEEWKEEELWPERYGYDLSPEKSIEEEELKVGEEGAGPTKEITRIVKGADKSAEAPPVKMEKAAKGQSFFRFNQLVFFITGSILFLLAVFAAVVYSWEYMNDLGRGVAFFVLSIVVLITGILLRSKDFNRYLEVITFHASFILFAIGTVFLLSGAMGNETLMQGVILLSLLIPMMVILVGYHFRYVSIAAVAWIGYLVAVGYSLMTWPEGTMIANSLLFLISLLIYVAFKGNLSKLENLPFMKWTERYQFAKLEDLIYSYGLILFSISSFIVAQSILIHQVGPGSGGALLLSSSGIMMLLMVYSVFLFFKEPALQVIVFYTAVLDAIVQYGLLNGSGYNGGSIAGLVLTVPFYLLALFSLTRSKGTKNRLAFKIVMWSSGLGICLFIIGLDPVLGMDVHSKNAFLLAYFSIFSLVLSKMLRNAGNYVFSLFVLVLTGSYFALMKMELTAFIVILMPIIFGLHFKAKKERILLRYPFLFIAIINYILLWIGPLEPYPLIDSFIGPFDEWWKGSLALGFSAILLFSGSMTKEKTRFWAGSVMFLISTWLAMIDLGDLMIMVFFLLPAALFLSGLWPWKKKGPVLAEKDGAVFRSLLVLASSVLFITLWFCPSLVSVHRTGLDWPWWKSIVALSFSLTYLVWTVASYRTMHFIAVSLFISTVAIFNTVYHSELFSLAILVLPLLFYILEKWKRISTRMTLLDQRSYLAVLSLILTASFVLVLSVKPIDPILDIGYDSLRTLMGRRIAISMAFTLTFLGWGLFRRSHYYYLLGSALLVSDCILLSLLYCELFLFVPLVLPLLVFLKEKIARELGQPRPFLTYLTRLGYLWDLLVQGEGPPKERGYEVLPNHWSFRHVFPLFLLPLSLALLFGPRYPLFDVPIGTAYWKFLIGTLLCIPVFAYGIRSELGVPTGISSFIFIMATLMISVLKLELLVFLLFIPPVALYLFKVYGPMDPGSKFDRTFQICFLLPFLLGYLVLWIVPLDPEIDLGLGSPSHLLFKGLITLFYGSLLSVGGYIAERKGHLFLGLAFVFISLLFLSVIFLEPLVFVILLVPPLLELISKQDWMLRRSEKFHDFIQRTMPMNNLWVFVGFVILFLPSAYPVIDVGTYGRWFWIYRGLLLLFFSGAVLSYGMFKMKDPITTICGAFIASISIFVLSITVLNELLFLVLPIYYILSIKVGDLRFLGKEGPSFRWIYRSYAVFIVIAFMMMWIMPIFSFYHIPLFKAGYWSLKSVLCIIFSLIFYLWGLYKKERSTVILSLMLATITIVLYGMTTVPIVYLCIIVVSYLISLANKIIEPGKGTVKNMGLLGLFQNLYLFAISFVFILIWIPATLPLFRIEPWSSAHFLYRAFMALSYTATMMFCCVVGDRPYHFLYSHLFIFATSFVLVITVSEPFSLIIYLVPLSLFIVQIVMENEAFIKAAQSIYRYSNLIIGREPERRKVKESSLYGDIRHAFLIFPAIFFFILFIMVWARPIVDPLKLNDGQHLWYITVTMFIFALVPLFWGLKGTLRVHVLIGVLFIVIDGWVLFLSQMKGLGVVISLFFTAAMFLAGGLYFVWASKRKGSAPRT